MGGSELYTPAKFDDGFLFDGSTYLEGSEIIGGNEASLTFFVQRGSATDTQLITIDDYQAYPISIHVTVDVSGNIELNCRGDSNDAYYSFPATVGVMYHIAMTFSTINGQAIFYVDGVNIYSQNNWTGWAYWDDNSRYYYGSDYYGDYDMFDGILDQVRYFNRPLTQEEVTHLQTETSDNITLFEDVRETLYFNNLVLFEDVRISDYYTITIFEDVREIGQVNITLFEDVRDIYKSSLFIFSDTRKIMSGDINIVYFYDIRKIETVLQSVIIKRVNE